MRNCQDEARDTYVGRVDDTVKSCDGEEDDPERALIMAGAVSTTGGGAEHCGPPARDHGRLETVSFGWAGVPNEERIWRVLIRDHEEDAAMVAVQEDVVPLPLGIVVGCCSSGWPS